MALKIIRGKILPIGVDLGTSMVKLAQLRSTADGMELLAAGSADLPRPCRKSFTTRLEAAGPIVHNILKSNPFKGRQCILSLPAEMSLVQHIKLPKMSADQTASALQFELQGKLPYSLDDAVVRYVSAGEVFGEGEARQELVIVATQRSTVDSCLRMARRAGLDVAGINIEACAVVECFARMFRRSADAARTILFIDVGSSTTQVALSHGDRLVFARNLMVGGEQLDQSVADALKISIEQAHTLRSDGLKAQPDTAAEDELYHLMESPIALLAEQLTQCLHYYESVFRSQVIERAVFVGGQAYDKRLCQTLAQRLNLPAQIGDPLVHVKRVSGAGLDIGLDRREPQPHWAVAIGLSLGGGQAA